MDAFTANNAIWCHMFKLTNLFWHAFNVISFTVMIVHMKIFVSDYQKKHDNSLFSFSEITNLVLSQILVKW